MNILSFLLPGLRELRAPLAAGYVWLVALALALSVGVATSATSIGSKSLSGDIRYAYNQMGVAGRFAALTFAAYVVGVVSTSITTALSRTERARNQPEMLGWAETYIGPLITRDDRDDQRLKLLDLLLKAARGSQRPPGSVRWFFFAQELQRAGEWYEKYGYGPAPEGQDLIYDEYSSTESVNGFLLAWVEDPYLVPDELRSGFEVPGTRIVTGDTERASIF
jgi:hypothetical protein